MPSRYLKYPATATIAALSVVNLRSGMNASMPWRLQRSATAARTPLLADHAAAYGHRAHARELDGAFELSRSMAMMGCLQRRCEIGLVGL